jgi:hypothetical protein
MSGVYSVLESTPQPATFGRVEASRGSSTFVFLDIYPQLYYC